MRNKSLKIAVALLLLVILAIIGVIAVILGKQGQDVQQTERKLYRQVVSVDAVKEDVPESVNFITCYKKNFVVKKNSDGTASISCYVGNDASNVYDDMNFALIVSNDQGDKQQIYVSGGIPRGKYIDTIELSSFSFEPGKYSGELIHYIQDRDGKQIKSVSVAVDIIVK